MASTNNERKVIASYFFDCLNTLELGPKFIGADRGSKNSDMAGTQKHNLTFDQCFNGMMNTHLVERESSFPFGSSITIKELNQFNHNLDIAIAHAG